MKTMRTLQHQVLPLQSFAPSCDMLSAASLCAKMARLFPHVWVLKFM